MLKIIINADDFGLDKSCTQAICEAFKKGFITDTTMVANGEAYREAIECIKEYGLANKVGIHFNLTTGVPLSNAIKDCKKFVDGGTFHGQIKRWQPLSKYEKQAVYSELCAQIEKLKSDGIFITHADSHHHIHTAIFIAPIVIRVCKEHGIKKIRLHRNLGHIVFYKNMIKKVFNQWVSRKGFITTQFFGALQDVEIDKLKGTVEIMVHPDYNERGDLIDRKRYVDDIPIGEKMYSLLEGNNDIVYSSYYEV